MFIFEKLKVTQLAKEFCWLIETPPQKKNSMASVRKWTVPTDRTQMYINLFLAPEHRTPHWTSVAQRILRSACSHILPRLPLKLNSRPTVSWLLPRCRAPIWSLWPDFHFLPDNCWFLDVGRPLWREDGSVIYSYNCFWSLPGQSPAGPSPTELRPYLIWDRRARSPYLYPPGTGWPT
jgi:hypothetical protein